MITDALLTKKYRYYSILLFFILLLLIYIPVVPFMKEYTNSYIWQNYIFPIIWTSYLFWFFFFVPKIHPVIKCSKKDRIYFEAIICAVLYLIIHYIVGILIFDIGKTPYDISPKGIYKNFVTAILPFVVKEIVRTYILCSYRKKKDLLLFLLISLVMTCLDLNISKFQTINSLEKFTIYFAEVLGPAICNNLLLSYLAIYGGALASIIYGGTLLVFHWFIPYLPNLNWLGDGVVGIMVPIITLLIFINKYDERVSHKHYDAVENKKNSISWLLTFVFSIGLIWFVVGVFPIYPTVIVTGSMKPLISPGDVVILKRFYSQEEIMALNKGDVIAFQRDNIIITHRIIDRIVNDDGIVSYKTKGDNNSAEDTIAVQLQDIRGKYIYAVPKIGYPTLWLKTSSIKQEDGMEY